MRFVIYLVSQDQMTSGTNDTEKTFEERKFPTSSFPPSPLVIIETTPCPVL